METDRGDPNSHEAEAFAIRTALDVCSERGLLDFVIFSDCDGAVTDISDERVQLRTRKELYLPKAFLEELLGRPGYLRSSPTVPVERRRPKPIHRAPRRNPRTRSPALDQHLSRQPPTSSECEDPNQRSDIRDTLLASGDAGAPGGIRTPNLLIRRRTISVHGIVWQSAGWPVALNLFTVVRRHSLHC